MLDDQNVLAQKDPDGALDVAASQYEQLDKDYDVNSIDIDSSNISNIVLVGMGGSALAALVAKSWLKDKLNVPLEVYRDYSIPKYTNQNTLFIASSYSGNTEETVAALHQAEEQGAQIVIMAAGGSLSDIAASKDYSVLLIPSGMQPRFAVLYSLKAIAQLFEHLGLCEGIVSELVATKDLLHSAAKNWEKSAKLPQNDAKKIALDLAGKTPIILAGSTLGPAAYKWKISFNENAKNVAYHNEFPEFNHNEFIGWTSHPVEKPFGIVELRSNFDHPQVQRRFDVSNRLLSGKMPHPIEIQPQGKNQIEQLLWTIELGDFVSIYLAILNGVNPTPVELIERLKTELA